jgi:hypothetical protein
VTTNERISYAAHRFVFNTSLDSNCQTSRYVGNDEELNIYKLKLRSLEKKRQNEVGRANLKPQTKNEKDKDLILNTDTLRPI